MKRIIIIISLIITIIVSGLGQQAKAQINADSLEASLVSAGKAEKLTILNTLSNYYLVKSTGKSIEYATQARSIANELKNIPGKIVALLNTGDAYLQLGDVKLSIAAYKQALETANSASLQKDLANIYIKIGNNYCIQSKYDEALKNDLEALRIYKSLDDSHGLSDAYHNLGIVYYYLGSLDKALEFSQNALKIREKLSNRVLISKSLNNIAMIYMNMENNDLALEYYQKALKLMDELNNTGDMAITLSNIGITYKQKGEFQKAINSYLKSLDLYNQFNDDRNKSRLLACLGATYTELNKFDKAESYLEQGLSLAKKSGYLDIIALNYRYLADLYLMMGNYKKTLDYKNLYTEIKDSVFNEDNQKRIAEMQVRIETDNTQREAALIKEKSNITSILIIIIAAAIVLMAIVLYSRYRIRTKAQVAYEQLNSDKNEANIAIEQLILWSRYQNGTYKFAPVGIKLTEEIKKSISQSKPLIDSKKINVNNHVNGSLAYADSAVLDLIIRSLVHYAVKYSATGDNLKISARANNNHIEVTLSNSGFTIRPEELTSLLNAGIQNIISDKGLEPGEKISLALCREFIELSGGSVRIEKSGRKDENIVLTLPTI